MQPAMAIDEDIHRFTTPEYLELVESGAFADLRVELLDGLILDMNPPLPPHVEVVHALLRALGGRLDLVRVHSGLPIGDGWVPEPDIALAEWLTNPPRWPDTIYFVAEVAYSSHRRDHRKADAYARAGIRRYWIVDVPGNQVLEHTRPSLDGYKVVRPLSGDDLLDSGVEGIAPFTVAELFSGLS
jgi:Uma2 family endonuclease